MRVAEPRQKLALARIDADPRATIRQVDVDRHVRPDLTDEETRRLGAALHIEAGRTVHVVPLRLILAVAVEHLDAVVLTVGDIDPTVRVAADVVGDVELPGIGAGLAPRKQALAVWC